MIETKVNNSQLVLGEIQDERNRQIEKWGIQNHKSVEDFTTDVVRLCEEYEIPTENRAKFMCEKSFSDENPTWTHIAIEELSEVVCAKNDYDRRQELIQLAAVCLSWIECIDRNNQ